MHTPKQQLQIFVQSPELQIPIRALTLNPVVTIRHLKLSLLPQNLPAEALDSFFFTFNGRPISDSSTIKSSQLAPLSTLNLRFRLPGGGGDGGATGAESRDCYLNMYAVKKPDKVDPNEQKLSKFTNCALSNEPLKHPIVVDLLGNVFNKMALVEALLGKKLPKAFGHIKGLKDMIAVELALIPGLASVDDAAVGVTRFQCPISGLEFNGKYKFFALRTCGHVLSSKALKEVKSSGCLVCHKDFSESDKIVINGSEEEVKALRERMEEDKAKLREKKVKKVKNGNADEGVCMESSRLSGTKHEIDDIKVAEKVSAKLKNWNVNVAANGANGGVKGASNGLSNGSGKRFKAGDVAPANATKEVYASIFTSSRKSDFKETYSCRSLPLGRN
ncbi:uncharacterized protein LOC132279761 [Cornus florida]|uniref:uncharacterized protein LOC132279761 n=1 Tax=Cornus florida TaxID=4283 RepID=UPI0028A1E3EA|nr:uncharacterized protein LOC132279761 [Cornus florida]